MRSIKDGYIIGQARYVYQIPSIAYAYIEIPGHFVSIL